MKNCSLFFPTDSLQNIIEQLQAVFADGTIEFDGSPDQWNQAHIKIKTGWFGKSTLVITNRGFADPQFAPMLQGMMNFAGQIPAQNPTVKYKLMTLIQSTKFSLGLVSDSGFDKFEKGIFQLIDALEGFAFVDGHSFMTKGPQLILNVQGQSEVKDLSVPDSHIRLGQAEQEASEELLESQTRRKRRSVDFLKARSVPVIEHLPCIDADEQVTLRTKEEVVKRAIALMIVAVNAEGLEQNSVQQITSQFNAEAYFTPEEVAFLKNSSSTEEERAKFGWHYEALWVMLWTLSFVDDLTYPGQICDVPTAVSFIRDAGSYEGLHEKAALRTVAEILDQADLIYRMHWACVDARAKGQPAPTGLEAGVVYERHYALNWLTTYMDQPWDEVRTDT